MPENPNSKIIKKVNNSDYDEAIKDFLKEALRFENTINHESKPTYTAKYDTLIRRHASKWKNGALRMIIDKIIINNFRQYKDTEIILSPPDEEKNFNIIQGTNGAGKTNLFNAITWCIYGKEIHRPIKSSGLPLLNNSRSESMQDGEKELVKVEIHMKNELDERILFRQISSI